MALRPQREQALDDGGVGVRPQQPATEQLEPGGDRPAHDRGADDQPVALGQLLPQPPRVVRLGRFRGAARQPELVQPDEPGLRALVPGRLQRRLEQDLRAAVSLAAAQAEHPVNLAGLGQPRHVASPSSRRL